MHQLIFRLCALTRSVSSPSSPSVFSRMTLAGLLLAGAGGLAAPASADVLVSNTAKADFGWGNLNSFDQAQAFTTGSDSDGYTVSSVEIAFRGTGTDPTYDVSIWSESSGSPSASLGTLTNPDSLSAGVVEFTTSGINLAASTTYFVVVDVSSDGAFAIVNTRSDDEDSSLSTGWSIADNSLYRDRTSTGSWTSLEDSKKIRINGAVNDATAPTVSSAEVNGTSLVVTFDEDLAAAANLANGAFTVKRTRAGTQETVTLTGSPTISNDTLMLTLGNAMVYTDTDVKVSYTKPGTDSNNRLEDAAGNEVASFTDQSVANNTAVAGSPGSPGRLIAVAGNAIVKLAWKAPEESGDSLVTGYQYQWKESGGSYGAWTATNHALGTHQTVTGLSNDTAYTFRVRAVNGSGAGGPSDEAAATPSSEFRPVIMGDSTAEQATTFHVTITFDRDVPELPRSAVVVNGGRMVEQADPGSPRKSRPDGREWTVHVLPNSNFTGLLTIDIPAGAVQDTDGNSNLAAVQYRRMIKTEHVRPRLFMDLAPKPGTDVFRSVLDPVTGPFTVRLNFAVGHIFHQPVAGLETDEIAITNGTKTNLTQIRSGSSVGDYEVTITPEPTYTGPFTITVEQGAAYACSDLELTTCDESNLSLGDTLTLDVVAPAALSVADAQVEEGTDATLDFVVTLSRSSTKTVTVAYTTVDGTATAGDDYTATSGTLTFTSDEREKTVSVPVLEDNVDEGSETLTLRLSNAKGASIADGEAVGTITNTDAMPTAWLARFGRTVTAQVLEAVEQRLKPSRQEGAQVRLAGQAIPTGIAHHATNPANNGEQPVQQPWLLSWNPTPRDFVTDTSFGVATSTGEGAGASSYLSLWGMGAMAGFDGRQDNLSLDGQVTTALTGIDWATGRWTAGLALGHSSGTGDYRQSDCAEDRCSGEVEATLTGLYPYLGGVQFSDRLAVWAAAGYGIGDLTLRPHESKSLSTDLTMAMGAAGLRSQLLQPDTVHGLSLALKGDARFTRTTSDEVRSADGNLDEAEADVWLIRAGIEAARPMALGSADATFTPSFEMGVRLDGGDAETGFGTDIGAALAFASPRSGLTLDLKARGLIAHAAEGFQEWGAAAALSWDPQPSSERGLSAWLTQSWGASPSGGMDALLQRQSMADLAVNDNGGAVHFAAASRLEAELGFGLPLLNGAFIATPNIGFGISDHFRDYHIGWRLTPSPQDNPGVQLQLEMDATRSESTGGAALSEHEVMLRSTLLW